MDKFGELLVALRKRNGLSQRNMAEILQVSVSAISKWENNQNYPDLVMIPQIAELLHISCDELLHPENTLKKLQAPTFQRETENTIMEKNFDVLDESALMHQIFLAIKNRLFRHKFSIAVLIFIICLVTLLFPTFINHYKQHTFRLMDTHKYVMTDFGPAYELVFYHPYKSTDEKMLSHADHIEELWQSGYYEDSTENILVLTYYLSKDDINNSKEIFFQSTYFLDDIQ